MEKKKSARLEELEGKLSPKHLKVVLEYLADPFRNKTQAMIRGGYSEKTARQAAWRLFTNVYINEYIQLREEQTAEKLKVTALRIEQEFAKLAFFNPKAIIGKTIDQMSGEEAAAIKKYDATPTLFGKAPIIEFHDKRPSLDSLSRIKGLFNDNEKDGDISYEEKLKLMSVLLQERDVGSGGK